MNALRLQRHWLARSWRAPVTAAIVVGLSPAAAGSAAAATPAGAPTSAVSGARVVSAAEKTSALRSTFTMSFRHTTPTTASSTPVGVFGVEDFSAPAGTLTLDLPGGSSVRERMVFLPGTVFVKPPSSSPPLQPGRPWIFANFADIAKYDVNFPPYIVQTESVNPALVLYELAWGTTSATSAGPAQHGGVTTHHYRARVNLNQRPGPRRRPGGGGLRPSHRRGDHRLRRERLHVVGVHPDGRMGGRRRPVGRGPGHAARGRHRDGDPRSRPVRIRGSCVETAPGQGGGHRRHDPRRRTGGAQRRRFRWGLSPTRRVQATTPPAPPSPHRSSGSSTSPSGSATASPPSTTSSLTVDGGQVLGLVGPNGSGKTLTLKILLGLVRPTSGSAWLFGEPVGPGVGVLGPGRRPGGRARIRPAPVRVARTSSWPAGSSGGPETLPTSMEPSR